MTRFKFLKPDTALVEILDFADSKKYLTDILSEYETDTSATSLLAQQVGARYDVVRLLQASTISSENDEKTVDYNEGDLCLVASGGISTIDGLTSSKKYGFIYLYNIIATIEE